MKSIKHFGLLAAVCMLACCCTAPFSAFAETGAGTLYGDANTDGAVDVADAVLDARFCAEDREAVITDQGRINGDVNADGNIDNGDIEAILEYIARKRTVLGPEKPAEKLTKTVDMMEGIERSDVQGMEIDDAYLNAQFDLTAKLMKEISKETDPDKDILISPLSISLALSMATNGAKEETRTEMEQLLGGDIDIETLNAYNYEYISNLPSANREKLDIANSVWIKDDVSRIDVPEEFLRTNKDYYDAGVFRAPFDGGTVKDVNDWVSKKTGGMIPELIQDFDPLEVMVLINALYFDADWQRKYQGQDVNPGTFYLNEHLETDEYGMYVNVKDEDKIKVDYMGGREDYYVQDEQSVGFVKPYANGNYSFVGLRPNDGVTVQDYIDSMDGASLKKLMDSKTEHRNLVFTSLPKFQSSFEITLNDSLKALGMNLAFDPKTADFTGLNKLGETWIGKVLHKTVIDVNETGTRAAAVTSVHFMGGAGLPQDAVFVFLDKPFIYMIVDNRTNLPVFIGTQMHPEYKNEQ